MIKFTDNAPLGMVKDTADGFMIAMSRVARTGVQDYRASELGMSGNHIVRVNRPESAVFNKDAMASLTHAPVTVNHPAENVTADNWKDLAVGEVGEGILRDGEWLGVSLIVKDAKGIEAARSTHQEISMGYTADIVDAPEGVDFDLEMTNIKFNHLALVPKGRAGAEARIGDGAHNWGATPVILDKEVQMDIKTIVVGDKAVQVAASDASTVEQVMRDHKAEVEALKAEIEARDTTIGELKAENADTAKKVMSDADIAAAVVARKAVTDKAAEFVKEFKDEGRALADIKRNAVKAHFGDDAAAAEVSDAEINGIFRVMTPKKVNDEARKVLSDKKSTDADPWGFVGRKETK